MCCADFILTCQPPRIMQLLLTVCVTWALLHAAESLHCHECIDSMCTNTTSVKCPVESTLCKTITSVKMTGAVVTSSTVEKNCSSILSCFSPASVETEWSVNNGTSRQSHTQICCTTDNCNFQTLAAPNSLTNGKVCPTCATLDDSLGGTCNATLDCRGVENSCFTSKVKLGSQTQQRLGCVSRNLCLIDTTVVKPFADAISFKCGAPWSAGISTMLVAFALTLHKFIF